MSYTPTVQDYELLKNHNKEQRVRLVFLDKDTFISYGEVQADLIDYSLDVDSNSDYRRILSLDIIIDKSELALFKKNAVLLNRIMQMYIGLSDNKNDIHWYLIGTFAFTDKTYTYNAATNQLSINCTDMTSYLNGELGGNIIGANNTTIYAYQDNLQYGKVQALYNDNDMLYATYFSPNTKITLPLPYNIYDTSYKFDITVHKCGHRNQGNIGDYGGHVAIVLDSNNVIPENNIFTICDTQSNICTDIQSDNNHICTYLLNNNSGTELLITALCGVNISRIEIYDYFVSIDNPIVVWNFGYTYNFTDGYSSVYPQKQICNSYNVLEASNLSANTLSNTLTDVRLQDERFTIYAIGSSNTIKLEKIANRGYDYDYDTDYIKSYYITQPMISTIDTLEGKHITVKEVVAALLTKAGITKYNIDEITEVIPFDQDFSSVSNYYDIIHQIASLYENIEMFFDTDGTFIMRHIPTTDEAPCILTDDILKSIVIEEKYNEDLTSFYNVTEIWGTQIDADYYTANNQVQTFVDYDEEYNCINATYENIGTTDNGKIIDGTVLALLTPVNIANHPDNISMCINNMNSAAIDTKNIQVTKLWQVDKDFYWDNFEPYFVSSVNGMPYKDMVFYGYNVNFEDDGNNQQYYLRSDTVHASCIIDNIDFSYSSSPSPGTFGNPYCNALLFVSPNYIYDEQNAVKKLNVSSLASCIKFNAKKGEVIRFYFAYQPSLSVADAEGNILTNQTSNTNIDNKISYMDFYPLTKTNDTYYVFDGITNNIIAFNDGSCAAIFGMSKFNYTFPAIPIKDMYTDEPLTQGYLEPNTSYCFQYSANTLYYLGQWQVHAVAIEMKEIPNSNDEFSEKYNCKNIMYTSYNPTLALDVVGEKSQSLQGGDYENIYSDGLALQRADWENWKSIHSSYSLDLKTLCIPWLEVNNKCSYKSNNDVLKTYLINKISINSDGTMDLSFTSFIPRYKNTDGYILKNFIVTANMTNSLPNDNTMFSNSLYNYNLFDYKFYANKYQDIKQMYGYNALQLWQHWYNYGIREGRQCSKIYDPAVYKNYNGFISEQNIYLSKIKSAFGSNYTNDAGYINMAMYLHFLDKGITDYNVVCSNQFNIKVYSANEDLKAKYGNEWRKYYEHYVKYNYIENRVCI